MLRSRRAKALEVRYDGRSVQPKVVTPRVNVVALIVREPARCPTYTQEHYCVHPQVVWVVVPVPRTIIIYSFDAVEDAVAVDVVRNSFQIPGHELCELDN